MKKSLFIILFIIVIDQCSKIYVKTNFALHESVEIFSWFRISFLENLGMAYGISFGGETGKIFLSILRMIMITFIGVWLFRLIKRRATNYLVIPITFIFAGALGNLIDSIFYGLIFNSGSTFEQPFYSGISELDFTGYSSIMLGAVVDMLQFPLFSFVFPQSVPIVGGEKFEFFQPVFNIADSIISIGVFFLIIFNNKAFPKDK